MAPRWPDVSSARAQWDSLRPYQQQGARALAAGGYVGLWYGPGLGKTATALASWSLTPEVPVLVVTQAIGRYVFRRDARWLFGDESLVAILRGQKQRSSTPDKDGCTYTSLHAALDTSPIVVTNYDVIAHRYKELSAVPWACLILDEAHALKGGFARPYRYRSTGNARWTRYHYCLELARKVQDRDGLVRELTATPIRDRTRDLWAQLEIVLPHETLPFFPPRGTERHLWRERSWAGRYCCLREGEYGLDTSGSSNLEELRDYLQRRFLVLRRSDVHDQLPCVTRDVREVAAKRIDEYLGGGVENALARAALAKLDSIAEIVYEYLNSRGKVVVVTNRRRLAIRILQELSRPKKGQLLASVREALWSRSVSGETDAIERVRVTDDFQRYQGPALLVATYDSIGVSIDLHQADALVFAALPYTPAQIEQTEGRVGRLGGKAATIYYLIGMGTIDEQIRLLVLDKLEKVVQAGVDTQGGEHIAGGLRSLFDEDEVLAGLRSWLDKEGKK